MSAQAVGIEDGRRPRVAIVDYGAGNLVSIGHALSNCGADAVVARDAAQIRAADGLVVPGVGAAGPAMARLARRRLIDPILAWVAADRPFLGICLGLQLLFEASDEDGAVTLGVIPGRSSILADAPTLPHIGWNQVEREREHDLFSGIADAADFYFVHSYAGVPAGRGPDVTLARTSHGRSFVSAIAVRSVLGVQFHPERSGSDGLRLLANFVGIVGGRDPERAADERSTSSERVGVSGRSNPRVALAAGRGSTR